MAKPVVIHEPTAVMRHATWLKTASVAGLKGDWLAVVSGYAKRAASGTAVLIGLLAADWTNDTTNDPCDVLTDELGTYKMDTSATLVQATHVGNAYDLTDERVLNLSGTSNKPLVVVGIAGDGDALVRINKHLSSGSL